MKQTFFEPVVPNKSFKHQLKQEMVEAFESKSTPIWGQWKILFPSIAALALILVVGSRSQKTQPQILVPTPVPELSDNLETLDAALDELDSLMDEELELIFGEDLFKT